MRMLKPKKSFRKEFKRQVKYAIMAAVGFIIAFAWRDAIINSTRQIVEKFEATTKTIGVEISTSILITIVGVLIILISSRLLREK